MVGEEGEAVRLSEALLKRGMFVPAIRYPTVARQQARLRLTVTAGHRAEDVDQFLVAWRESVEDLA
jgi:7-keto-8-aminopelargonate synthetase-like enzyme